MAVAKKKKSPEAKKPKKTITTKAPTGLTIKRSGNQYTASWKIGDKDYGDGQWIQLNAIVKFRTGKIGTFRVKRPDKIGSSKTSYTTTLDASNLPHYGSGQDPVSFEGIQAEVWGNRKKYTEGSGKKKKSYNPGVSAHTKKMFKIYAPARPSVSFSRNKNVSTFSWSTATKDDDGAPFTRTEWQTSFGKDGKTTWSAVTIGGASGSKAYTEDLTALAGNSYYRRFRVRAYGIGGYTDWAYSSHIYAAPIKPSIRSAKFAGGTAQVDWNTPSNGNHPVDTIKLMKTVTAAGANLTCPDDASWSDVQEFVNSGQRAKYVFQMDAPEDDQTVWVKASSTHDDETVESDPFLVSYGGYRLSAPTLEDVAYSGTTLTVTATNNSNAEGVKLLVRLKYDSNRSGQIVYAGDGGSLEIAVPYISGESYWVECQAVQAKNITSTTLSDGSASYSVSGIYLQSQTVVSAKGIASKPPQNVTVTATGREGVARLSWEWSWSAAEEVQIAWADHDDAWESTDEPTTYRIDSKATHWNVANLEEGTYYFRARLIDTSSDNDVFSDWSAMVSLDIANAPKAPTLTIDKTVVTATGSVTLIWTVDAGEAVDIYLTDGTNETLAIHDAEYTQAILSIADLQKIKTLEAGTSYSFYAVAKQAGKPMDGMSSNSVSFVIADPVTCSITETSLGTITRTDEDGNNAEQVTVLQDLPLTVKVTGAGDGGTTSLIIRRAEDYKIATPDGRDRRGYQGDAIAAASMTGEGTFSIPIESLAGSFDDGARYEMVATVTDIYGQTAQAEQTFEVAWSHQAVIPSGRAIVMRGDGAARINIGKPEGTADGDVCDIYRLTTDLPEIIYKGASYGATYVDPYPAFGENSGYRLVSRTKNGDMTTADNHLAWEDIPALNAEDTDSIVINFNGDSVELPYNVSLSNKWSKDFERTEYLGGNIAGDWNPAVTRDLSASGITFTEVYDNTNLDVVSAMRRLAMWPGICHVRTPDGSSFSADVQVSENRDINSVITKYSLSISAVDSSGSDAVTEKEWNNGLGK